ncbi:MAG: A/G-specific adenine glycosylase [Thermogutta sp.]
MQRSINIKKTVPPGKPYPVRRRHRRDSARAPAETFALPSDGRRRAAFQRRLTAWFRRHARSFPWRETRDPYAIWVSEIMLQQTQTAAVEPFFRRFLARFPDVASLAAADQDEVLRFWEGLGYYRRARSLHAAAQRIVELHGGQIPDDAETLQSLPGIGRYTAGAILSFAFDQPAPILEANSRRVLSRILADPKRPLGLPDSLLWELAERLVPARQSGVYNQALMELGSLVCLVRAPRCRVCPVRSYCMAFRLGIQDQIAGIQAASPTTTIHESAVAIFQGPSVLLLRRAAGGRWAGMWDFPRVEITHDRACTKRPPDLPPAPDRLEESVRRSLGLSIRLGTHFLRFRHAVTRFRITVDCFLAAVSSAAKTPPKVEFGESGWTDAAWLEPSSLEAIPLSSPGRRIANALLAIHTATVGETRRQFLASPPRRTR